MNAAFCELTGYTEEELLSRTVNDLNWPEDREWDLKQYELALQTGRYEVEKRYLRKDGRPVWVHASGSILRDERGRPVRTVVVVKDVTESRAAAERLRESEMRLRMAMEAAFLISFEWDILRDEVRRFVSTEPALPATKENAPDTYEGVRRCVHPEDRERFSENVEAALRSESGLYRNEYRVVRPDGGLSWVSESGRVERDASGKPVRLVGLSQDITERKAAEQELRETTERLRAVLENSLDAAYRRDLRTDTYDYLSPVVEEVLGMTPEELRGLSVGEFLARMHPEDRARAVEAIESGMRLLKGRVEYRIRLRDGRYRWVADHFKVQTDEGGRPIYRSGIVRDAEERKRAEERLRQQEAELRAHTHDLERLVQERTAKLTELVGELEHFSYSITHDMRAPLRAMRGFADLAAEMSKDTPHPEVKGLLQRIMTSAERMDLLITDALNYSKAVREELPLGPVDVLALLRGMLDTYPEFQQHRANIQVTREMPCVLGNEAGLTQCFSNLLGNAIKFTAKGVPPVVRVWSEVRGEWVRIWVEDNGIGIPPALLPKLFQMFTRGAAGYEGTGIGLALVRKVVQRMGGYVGVESESDRGSRFWVELRTAPTGRTHAAISAESAETD